MSATKPVVASSSGIGMKIVGDEERVAGDAGEIELVERVDHRRRRVARAEELHPAALVARALGERQIAAGRRHEGVDQQTRDRAEPADRGRARRCSRRRGPGRRDCCTE